MPKRRTAFYTARKAANLTQKQAEHLSGVPATVISDLETGVNRNPTWSVLSRLAFIYGVRVEQLIDPVKPPKRKLVARIVGEPLRQLEASA